MPFWVEWGDAIWQVAFILSVAVGAGWKWSSPRRQAKRETTSWIVESTPVDRFEEGANTIIEGVLEGGADSVLVDGATVATIQGLASSAVDQVPIAVSVGDELIELQGPMELMLGSEEIRPRKAFHRDGALHARVCALPDGPLAAGQLEGQAYVIRWLRAGDRVQARGVLRRSAAQGESGYRETQGRWVLRGSEQRPLTLGSATPPHMAQKDVDRLALGALLGGLVFAGVFIGLAALMHNASDDSSPGIASALTMTPLHRDDGVEMLRERWRSEPSAAGLERLAELVDMKDGCHGSAMLWALHGQSHRAIEAAQTCDHPIARLAAARAHYALGDMTEASRSLQDVRDELSLEYSPTHGATVSREAHAVGATRAHLARARWRTAARELDNGWMPGVSCVADVARRRAGLDASLLPSTGEACMLLEASEQSDDPAMLQMLSRLAIARLLLREADPGLQVFPSRSRSHRAEEQLSISEMHLAVPPDPTCPIDPRGAPGLERSALEKLLEEGRDDQPTRQLIRTLAARRALLEAVAGRRDRVTAYLDLVQRVARVAQGERIYETIAIWDVDSATTALSDEAAHAAWNDSSHDRNVLLRHSAGSEAGRALIELSPDRPVLGTFREHFCDAAARAVAAERAGMHEVAREQREIAHRFRRLLEGRRAAMMLWVLDRRAD